jgi:hypothetical protein
MEFEFTDLPPDITFDDLKADYVNTFFHQINENDRHRDLDVFAIYMCYDLIVHEFGMKKKITQYKEQNETYVALWCTGFYDQNNFAPSIREVRNHEFYSDIDFMKLLLRGYDLVEELKLDLEEMFKQYSEADEQHLFQDETRYTFLRKNDPDVIFDKNPDILDVFTNI